MKTSEINRKNIEVIIEGVPIGNILLDVDNDNKIHMVQIYDDWLHTSCDLKMLDAFIQKTKEYEWSEE